MIVKWLEKVTHIIYLTSVARFLERKTNIFLLKTTNTHVHRGMTGFNIPPVGVVC